MCNCGNTITTSSVCSSCVPNDCACPIKDLSTDCIQYTGEDLPCTEILGGTLMTEAFSQLDTYLCDLSTQLANSFSLISVGAGTRVYKGVDGIGRKEIRSITPTNTILTVGLSTDNKEVEIGLNTTLLTQFIQANQITYAATNIGLGSSPYKNSTTVGNNVTFNFRKINSSDLKLLVTENTSDISIDLDDTLLGQFVQTNQLTYSMTNVGTGSNVYKSSTQAGNNVTFNLRDIKSTDSRVTVTEGPIDIDITLAANIAQATGTVNYVSKFTGIHTLGDSSIFDNGTNVGINNINPTSKLVVDANTNAADGIVSRNLNTGTSAYSFVGAFSNPSEGGIDLRSYPSVHLSWPSTSWLNSSSEKTNGLIVNQAGANPIRFFTNGSEKVRITPAGFVGIGVPTPTKILDVNGDIQVNLLTFGRGGGDNYTNVAAGYQALLSHNTGQQGHTVAIGFRAAQLTTTGHENMALGFAALQFNTIGAQNHAIGNGTLIYQTKDGSVGNGFLALAGVDASFNTAMGNAAAWGGGNGFPGSPPVGIGTGNTAIGSSAISELTDGNWNVAVGDSALAATTNGSENIGIGFGAAGQGAANFANIAIGSRAMWNSVIGDRNTVIGHFASATDFSDCVVLGAFAGATGSNQFVVGSASSPAGAIVTETNTSTKVWNVVINGVPVKILLA